jgi:hypothetical protein
LIYAQVVKVRAHSRVVEVERKVVFGDPEALTDLLTTLPTSKTINTSFIERHNLTQRQSNRRLTRRTNGFSKVGCNIESSTTGLIDRLAQPYRERGPPFLPGKNPGPFV